MNPFKLPPRFVKKKVVGPIAAGLMVVIAAVAVFVTGANQLSVTLKAPIAGLIDRQHAPTSAFYSVVDGYVLNVNWSALQAAAGGQITANNPIDQEIVKVRALNKSGAHLAIRVRLFAGIGAPNWAKALGGPPLAVTDPASGASGTIGRFWSPAFELAYADLENRLAYAYDGVPEIRETTISGCMTIYAEPFIVHPNNAAVLWNAGLTVAAGQECQRAAVRAHRAWQTTRSDLAFNPYQEILSAKTSKIDEPFTESMVAYCRTTLGAKCVLANNSLRSTSLGALYDSMYAKIAAAGPNITFQTATMARVGNLLATLGIAVGLGAASVELPSGYQTSSAGSYAAVRTNLIANAKP